MIDSQICPVCSATGCRRMIPAEYLPDRDSVFRCAACGSAFFETRRMEPDYWEATGQEVAYASPAVDEAFRHLHLRALNELENHLGKKGSLLDVGCGDGLFLRIAREAGWDATGLDASARGAELAREKSGCPVIVGTADGFKPEGRRWDVVTMWDVVEHLQEPCDGVRNLTGAVSSGGLVAIRTPNEGGFFRSAARLATAASFGALSGLLKYVYYHPHYVTMSCTGLLKLCLRCDLEKVMLRTEATPAVFAREKIRHAYSRHPGHRAVIALLPLAYLAGEVFGRNKAVIIARTHPSSSQGSSA